MESRSNHNPKTVASERYRESTEGGIKYNLGAGEHCHIYERKIILPKKFYCPHDLITKNFKRANGAQMKNL